MKFEIKLLEHHQENWDSLPAFKQIALLDIFTKYCADWIEFHADQHERKQENE